MENNIKYSLVHFGTWPILFIFIAQFGTSGCKKLVAIDPPINEVVGSEIYATNANACSVLTGIYADMSSSGIFTGQRSISVRTGLSGDELVTTTDPSNILTLLYRNSLTNNGDQLGFWSDLYGYIFRVNSAIEGISISSGVSVGVKQQLLGELKFLRAFYYFYLVNLYGNVPLLLSTDIKVNSSAPRVAKEQVYMQVVEDLKDAQSKLVMEYKSGDGVSNTDERIRPNRATATALLSRVYLYLHEWALAEQESTTLIDDGTYQLEILENVFLRSSKEAIWQLQPVGTIDKNTLDGLLFILAPGNGMDAGPNEGDRPVYLSSEIFNAFELSDKRKVIWVDSVVVGTTTFPYAFKYKKFLSIDPQSEYLMVLRLGEQYLIRAEARAQLGNISGTNSAESDVNTIRARAGLADKSFTNLEDILVAIVGERKVELFTEWGHRWLDLKRTAMIDGVMNVVANTKGSGVTWESYKALYPIPTYDIKNNQSLKGNQNSGYPEE